LFERLARDADALSVTFGVTGAPTQVRLGISDPHNCGRTAAVLTFANGRQLIYKPKDLAVDRAWGAFAKWLKYSGAPWYPDVPTVVSCELYGWTSFVETQSCTNMAERFAFFTKLGSMLALLHLLGATDCHRENFIAHGAEPVLVDLETLLSPRPKHDAMPEAMRDSVLAVEMLPCRYIGASKQEIYFPGFDGEWEGRDSKVIVAADRDFSLREHAEPFRAGFAAMYKFLLNHQQQLTDLDSGPLGVFRGCVLRYIHRPTMTYAYIQRRALRHLDSGAKWLHSLQQLQRYDPPGLSENEALAIRATEHAALERMDIPFFAVASNATDLNLENGHRSENFFKESALDRAYRNASRLSLLDLANQLEFISLSLGWDKGFSNGSTSSQPNWR
jgi:lantibiotic modifying enzyme